MTKSGQSIFKPALAKEIFSKKIMFHNEISLDEINNLSKKLRLNILKMAKAGGSKSSHFGGALSSVDFLAVLFKYFFDYSENKNKKFINDQFILSKGHACMVFYSILKELNIITEEDLLQF